ncbi:MAG: ABC transporter substrate-binding protein [Rhodospirillales bacterium]|nr:ABC transporter substrate-binding protein [Rhodospirillales bacterium]
MLRLTITLLCLLFTAPAFAEEPVHALAMHGAPKYGADFAHLDYVNPEAPKGGRMRLSAPETFDSLNQFITKGVSADGLSLIYDTLMEKSLDEPFTMYGLLAESIETPEDRSWVIFNLRPEAKWHDGQPITAEDVVWTFNTLVEKGRPAYRAYYHNVKSVEALDERKVKFTFDMGGNLELPLIVGELPVLPKHYWTDGTHNFEETSLEPPLGSGPYRIGKVDPGKEMSYERVADWWGKDLPIAKGRYNFDTVEYSYYRDQNISLEALFGDAYDFRQEYTAKLWATAYDAPAVKDGRIIKRLIENDLPQGMQGFVLNQRRPLFQDIAVRKALDLTFDFEWSNKQFAYDAYTRTRSYFANSEMEAKGVPEGRELEILEPFRGRIPDEAFTEEYNPAHTDGSGNNRANLRKAMKLLDDAGYVMGPDGVRVHKDTGARLEFEFLVASTNGAFERWFMPWKQSLEKIGIKGTIRIVDAAQYINRIMDFDYDMIVGSFGQSTSPGNEQREYWGSDRADTQGSRNYIGVKDPVVDELVDMIVSAPSREELVLRCRALDRVLQWGYYVVPNWHIAAWRVAYWDRFGQPAISPPYGMGVVDTWWSKEK